MTNNTNELCHLTIGQAAPLLGGGELSPVELTRAFLERVDSLDSSLNAYITVLADEALAEARTAEAEILRGDHRGPLHGVPIALKDLYDTAGVLTTASSRVMADRVPDEDATTTARLRRAGSVLLGKLAMHEFALGGPDPTNGFPACAQPMEPGSHPRRLKQRLGHRGVRRAVHGFARVVHRRLDTRAGVVLRHGGAEGNLRAGSAATAWCRLAGASITADR